MKIAVDAMGGDFGPQITVPGAVRQARDIVISRVQEKIQMEIAKAALPTGGAKA
jgi:fatty acid/phospholipid biosynthesis enzyme